MDAEWWRGIREGINLFGLVVGSAIALLCLVVIVLGRWRKRPVDMRLWAKAGFVALMCAMSPMLIGVALDGLFVS
ncbi:hypothetical protein [Streptomyces sp. NPDC050504]|uniref:hypothetical protein n=1 Tax=Streptomyces sp. NPDC050504 TaxID=3365618 RepID=UPI00379E1EFD